MLLKQFNRCIRLGRMQYPVDVDGLHSLPRICGDINNLDRRVNVI